MTHEIIINSDQAEVKTLADVALKHRLYVSGWGLTNMLKNMRTTGNGSIALAKENDVPIGVAIRTYNNQVAVFVRKNKRKNGIGKNLVSNLKIKPDDWHGYGVKGSGNFFKKCGLKG